MIHDPPPASRTLGRGALRIRMIDLNTAEASPGAIGNRPGRASSCSARRTVAPNESSALNQPQHLLFAAFPHCLPDRTHNWRCEGTQTEPLQKSKSDVCFEKSDLTKFVKLLFFGASGASPSWCRERAFTGHDRAGIGSGSIDGWPSGWSVVQGRRGRTKTGECAGRSVGRSTSRGG